MRRLLRETDNYSDYREIVANMPKPFGYVNGSLKGSYFINKIASYQYESKSLRDRPILPLILRRTSGQSNTFLLLYDMNGMNRINNYKEVIKDFRQLSNTSSSNDFEGKQAKIDVALAFFYDLDRTPLTDRIDYIKNTYSDMIPELHYLSEQKNIIDAQNFKAIGYYFLQKDENKGGSLEDIVLPLMHRGNEKLFEGAEGFLKGGKFARYNDNKEVNENKTQSDFKKSLIGTVGQIEHSGLGNEDVIKLSSLLDKDKLQNSRQCQEIIAFFKKLRDELR